MGVYIPAIGAGQLGAGAAEGAADIVGGVGVAGNVVGIIGAGVADPTEQIKSKEISSTVSSQSPSESRNPTTVTSPPKSTPSPSASSDSLTSTSTSTTLPSCPSFVPYVMEEEELELLPDIGGEVEGAIYVRSHVELSLQAETVSHLDLVVGK